MEILTIKRLSSGEHGTFGGIMCNDIPFAVTLEREWLDNKKGISCIPAGNYLCRRVNSPHFGDTFEVTNVSGRSHILFHKGNIDDDSHGCILLADSFGLLHDNPAIIGSKHGYNEFKQLLDGEDTFTLRIINCFKAVDTCLD